jgi:hypothetical protein
LTDVDMRRVSMFRWFRKTKELAADFCERCVQVCDAACRADEIRERALGTALRLGVRL